jgi:uncharacterized LabA/DUF88 family protein
MRVEPITKRAIAFFDGQNLFHAAKQAFGYQFPNYDPGLLAESIARSQGWISSETRFYTGVPDAVDSTFWNHFWNAKLAVMGTRGIKTYRRSLKYRTKTITLPSGDSSAVRVGQEKGIDIRIALDMVRLAHRNIYDVALIFSQDQDLSEAVDEIKDIASENDRWIKIASAFPASPTSANRRGINGSDWLRIDRETYDACLDPNNYRPKLIH